MINCFLLLYVFASPARLQFFIFQQTRPRGRAFSDALRIWGRSAYVKRKHEMSRIHGRTRWQIELMYGWDAQCPASVVNFSFVNRVRVGWSTFVICVCVYVCLCPIVRVVPAQLVWHRAYRCGLSGMFFWGQMFPFLFKTTGHDVSFAIFARLLRTPFRALYSLEFEQYLILSSK